MRGGDEDAPTESTMTIRTAKSSFSASTFAALAAHQAEMQGSFAAIEIGEHAVDVSNVSDTAECYYDTATDELAEAISALRVEAAQAGDMATVADCDAADTDIGAMERVCAVLCDAAAQE